MNRASQPDGPKRSERREAARPRAVEGPARRSFVRPTGDPPGSRLGAMLEALTLSDRLEQGQLPGAGAPSTSS
jgi:hypothetical protein